MEQPTPPPPAAMSFEQRIAQYVQLRDIIKTKDEEHKKAMKPYRDAVEQLEGILLAMLNETGQDSAKTKAGTAFRTTKRSATIADAGAFRRYIIGEELWDLVDWRANAPAIAEFIKEHREAPPGVNFAAHTEVNVRRPT